MEWVYEAMNPVYISFLIQNPNKWFSVPLGAASDDVAPKHLTCKVVVQYPQDNLDACAFYSLGSALAYCGLAYQGRRMLDVGDSAMHLPAEVQLERLLLGMQEHCPQLGNGQVFNSRRKHTKNKRAKITIEELVNVKTPFPTVVVPLGSRGFTAHAITVVDDLIFDSTQKWALKLCGESLDWICGENEYCANIRYAVRFNQSYNRKGEKVLQREMKTHDTFEK